MKTAFDTRTAAQMKAKGERLGLPPGKIVSHQRDG